MHELVAQDKGFCVNFEIMVGVLLVMFNDTSTVIRAKAARLAEVYRTAFASGKSYIETFTSTVKPTSIPKPN
jgi:frataxin-like iron-binding protein CyaY